MTTTTTTTTTTGSCHDDESEVEFFSDCFTYTNDYSFGKPRSCDEGKQGAVRRRAYGGDAKDHCKKSCGYCTDELAGGEPTSPLLSDDEVQIQNGPQACVDGDPEFFSDCFDYTNDYSFGKPRS